METASESNGYAEATCDEGKQCQQDELDEIELKVELLWTEAIIEISETINTTVADVDIIIEDGYTVISECDDGLCNPDVSDPYRPPLSAPTRPDEETDCEAIELELIETYDTLIELEVQITLLEEELATTIEYKEYLEEQCPDFALL